MRGPTGGLSCRQRYTSPFCQVHIDLSPFLVPFQIPIPSSLFAPPNLDGESMTASWASGRGGCGEKSGGDRKLGRTLGPASRWGGFSGTGGSGGRSSGTGDGGFVGGSGPGEPTARVSSVLHFGGKKVSSLPLFSTSQHCRP